MRRLAIAMAALSTLSIATAQQRRIYIAPDDHTDYFWTADETQYRQAFQTVLDYYLNEIDATASAPADYQAKWNCDGWIWLWEYERNKTPAEFLRLMSRVRDGHISAPLNPFCVCLGGTPTEGVLRGMYYAGRLERQHNVRFPLAYLMENQTIPLGVWSLFAGAGARWSWKGICGCNSYMNNPGDRSHDIYWATGLDGNRVLMKWNSLLVANDQMGGYAEARFPGPIVDYVTNDLAFQARYPFPVIGCFGKGWDDFQTMTAEFPQVAQSHSNAQRRVICSNETDFFSDFEANYGALIPAESLSYGNEWELHSAALAEPTSRVRRATEKLRTAEALAVMVARKTPALLDGRTAARELAHADLGMFYEHNFGMDGIPFNDPRTIGRLAWQRRLATEIDTYVDGLHDAARSELGDLLPLGANPRFCVFNPLGWQRTDVVDFAWSGATSVHVVDVQSQQEVPSQIVTVAAQQLLRVQARDVPAVGYRVYEVVAGPGSFANCGSITGSGDLVLDNGRHAVRVTAAGVLASIVDHAMQNREFARAVAGALPNDLEGAGAGTLVVEHVGPVSLAVRAQSPTPVPHTTVVTLYRDGDRIEVDNSIDANFATTLHWSYAFNLDTPDVHHEEVGAILHAGIAPAGHYAARTARLDYLSLGHFADMQDGNGHGITLSNQDCAFVKLGDSHDGTLDTATPRLRVLAGGTNLGSTYGLILQGGDSSFRHRFALRTNTGYDAAAAMRMALEHQDRLVAAAVTGAHPRLPATPHGLLTVSDPNVLLWAFKPAEDGLQRGLVARAWNVTDQPRSATLTLTQDTLRQAQATTHIETDEGALPVQNNGVALSFQPQQLRTVRLDQTAAASTVSYGTGCAGPAGVPTLLATPNTPPVLGQQLSVDLQPIGQGQFGVVVAGFSSTSSPLGPLPLDLTPVGFPGCSLLASPDVTFVLLPVGGAGQLRAPIPNLLALMGVRMVMQGAVLSGVSAGGALTAGLEVRLGY